MQNALITGADKGIGFAVAERLGRTGRKVLVASRDLGRGEEAVEALRGQGVDADLVELDVTRSEGIRTAAAAVRERHGRLDILVNNAGILPEATATERGEGPLDLALFRTTYDTNVFGAVAVVEEFLPLLREAPAGRIVNVSSTMGSLADQVDPESPYYGMVVPAYQSSKAALNAITIALSKALADTPIKVNSACPGWVRTDLAGPESKAAAPMSPEEGAAIVAELATIPADGPSGGFFDQNGPVRW
jgi:NAD(P)-dependent dehydrogenase (short-subunit alcohol dehydrogenase family)